MNFVDLGGLSFGNLWDRSRGPTRKNVGSLNPSKEQGARSKAGFELPGVIFMDSIEFHIFPLNLMNFVDLGSFWGECCQAYGWTCCPTRKNVGSLNSSKEQGWI